MASMAILRSAAARSLWTQQGQLLARRPVEEGGPLMPRLLSSSVPTERHKCVPSPNPRPRDSLEHKRHVDEKKEDIYRRLETKVDKLSDGLDKHSCLLQELKA